MFSYIKNDEFKKYLTAKFHISPACLVIIVVSPVKFDKSLLLF